MILTSIVLFFLLTPGILVSLPPKASKYVVALTHAIVFTALYHLIHRSFWRMKHMSNVSTEGLIAQKPTRTQNQTHLQIHKPTQKKMNR
jgi:hypothetical protein